MRRESANKINAGTLPWGSWALASVSVFVGVFLLVIADRNNVFEFALFVGFCLVLSLTCILRGRARKFTGSLLGVSLFVIGCWHLIEQFFGGYMLFASRPEPPMLNAVSFFFFFSLPGFIYALWAKFGLSCPNKGFNRTPVSSAAAKPGKFGGGAG